MKTFPGFKFPEKVRLSGADCFHLVLDKHAQKHGAGGNVMRQVFYFNKSVPAETINVILKGSPIIHWLCNIKLVSGKLFRVPHWKYTHSSNEIILLEHEVDEDNKVPEFILDRDIPLGADRFIEADLLHYRSGACAFVLSWNHVLMDAKGTRLLFDHLNRLSENKDIHAAHFFPATEKKTGLITHIRNMYKVKSFIQQSSGAPVSSIGKKHHRIDAGLSRYITFRFNSTETNKINNNAIQAGSRFGPSLFFIACCSQVIHLFNSSKQKKGDTWLPVPYDGRLKGGSGPLVSNSVSFIFYRLRPDEMNSPGKAVKSLAAQMTEQIKDGMPQKYSMFLDMMRYVPLWLYYLLISRTGEGTFASFLYTSTGENFNDLDSFFGEPVRDLALIPALTFPPGFTFVFLKHAGELKVEIAYSPDVIGNNDLLLIEEHLRKLLLTEN